MYASDKSGPSRYERATKRPGGFSRYPKHPSNDLSSKRICLRMIFAGCNPHTHRNSYAAQATGYPLFVLLVSKTTWVLLRALSFLMICRMCTFTVLSRIPSS